MTHSTEQINLAGLSFWRVLSGEEIAKSDVAIGFLYVQCGRDQLLPLFSGVSTIVIRLKGEQSGIFIRTRSLSGVPIMGERLFHGVPFTCFQIPSTKANSAAHSTLFRDD